MSVTFVLATFSVNRPAGGKYLYTFKNIYAVSKIFKQSPTLDPGAELLQPEVVKVRALDIEVCEVAEVGQHCRQHQGVDALGTESVSTH